MRRRACLSSTRGWPPRWTFFLPTELFFGEEKDPVSRLNRYYTGERDIWGGQAAEVNEQKGGAYSVAGQLVQGTTGATPNALLALMSGGGSIAAEGTAALGQAASGLGSTIASAASALAKNPRVLDFCSSDHRPGL